MAPKHLLQIRIDGAIKTEAATVLAAMGLTMSDAVRLLLTRVACEGALPFDPLMPNATTIAAMMAARVGDSGSIKETRNCWPQAPGKPRSWPKKKGSIRK